MKITASLSVFLLGFTFGSTGVASAADPAPPSYALCAACHGPDGRGVQTGPLLMAPSLHGSGLVAAGDGEILASLILTGIEKEDQKYLGMMAPLAAALTPEDLTAVMNYLRGNFGNEAGAVTEDQARGWIEKYAGEPMRKRKDLEALLP